MSGTCTDGHIGGVIWHNHVDVAAYGMAQLLSP